MPRATSQSGELQEIRECVITIPSSSGSPTEIIAKILPEISDSKGAAYNDEPVMGRSFPIKTFANGENRTISMKWHFIVTQEGDINENLNNMRALQSATYPREGTPYYPPPVCKIRCGKLLGESDICVVLRNYSLQFPTNVAWDENTLLPYYFEMSLNWEIVYPTTDLPGQERILTDGR